MGGMQSLLGPGLIDNEAGDGTVSESYAWEAGRGTNAQTGIMESSPTHEAGTSTSRPSPAMQPMPHRQVRHQNDPVQS